MPQQGLTWCSGASGEKRRRFMPTTRYPRSRIRRAETALSTPPLMATTTVRPAPSRGPIFSSRRSAATSVVGSRLSTHVDITVIAFEIPKDDREPADKHNNGGLPSQRPRAGRSMPPPMAEYSTRSEFAEHRGGLLRVGAGQAAAPTRRRPRSSDQPATSRTASLRGPRRAHRRHRPLQRRPIPAGQGGGGSVAALEEVEDCLRG